MYSIWTRLLLVLSNTSTEESSPQQKGAVKVKLKASSIKWSRRLSLKMFEIVRQNLEKSISANQKYYDKRGVQEKMYEAGELVLKEYPLLVILNWDPNMREYHIWLGE